MSITKTCTPAACLAAFSCACYRSGVSAAVPETLAGEIDTAAVVAAMDMRLEGDRTETADEKIPDIQSQIDTIEPTYPMAACNCTRRLPDDADLSADHSGLNEPGYRIEPANAELELPEALEVSGDKVIFTGRRYPMKKPGRDFIPVGPQPKESTLRHYAYQVVTPCNVWVRPASGKKPAAQKPAVQK